MDPLPVAHGQWSTVELDAKPIDWFLRHVDLLRRTLEPRTRERRHDRGPTSDVYIAIVAADLDRSSVRYTANELVTNTVWH